MSGGSSTGLAAALESKVNHTTDLHTTTPRRHTGGDCTGISRTAVLSAQHYPRTCCSAMNRSRRATANPARRIGVGTPRRRCRRVGGSEVTGSSAAVMRPSRPSLSVLACARVLHRPRTELLKGGRKKKRLGPCNWKGCRLAIDERGTAAMLLRCKKGGQAVGCLCLPRAVQVKKTLAIAPSRAVAVSTRSSKHTMTGARAFLLLALVSYFGTAPWGVDAAAPVMDESPTMKAMQEWVYKAGGSAASVARL